MDNNFAPLLGTCFSSFLSDHSIQSLWLFGLAQYCTAQNVTRLCRPLNYRRLIPDHVCSVCFCWRLSNSLLWSLHSPLGFQKYLRNYNHPGSSSTSVCKDKGHKLFNWSYILHVFPLPSYMCICTHSYRHKKNRIHLVQFHVFCLIWLPSNRNQIWGHVL